MEKLKTVKKKATMEGGIAAAVLVVLGGIYFLLSEMTDSSNQELTQVQGEVAGIAAQIADLERKYEIVKSSMLKYQDLADKLKAGTFDIGTKSAETQDKAIRVLKALDDKYRTMSLNLTIPGDPTLLSEELYKKKTAETRVVDVTLAMDAYTDIHIFSFLNEMSQKLPGFFKYTEFSIQRERTSSIDLLAELSRGDKTKVVSCNIKGSWYGLFPKLPELTPQGGTPTP